MTNINKTESESMHRFPIDFESRKKLLSSWNKETDRNFFLRVNAAVAGTLNHQTPSISIKKARDLSSFSNEIILYQTDIKELKDPTIFSVKNNNVRFGLVERFESEVVAVFKNPVSKKVKVKCIKYFNSFWLTPCLKIREKSPLYSRRIQIKDDSLSDSSLTVRYPTDSELLLLEAMKQKNIITLPEKQRR